MLVNQSNCIVLAGGHVPTQNAFFQQIHLSECLKGYKGVVVGISAGSMNSARCVYAQPEREEEVRSSTYKRFLDGLGLTNKMILPHYQSIKEETLAGLKIMEEITLPDSQYHDFYALVDGSYFMIEDEKEILFGEAYLIQSGQVKQICSRDQSLDL